MKNKAVSKHQKCCFSIVKKQVKKRRFMINPNKDFLSLLSHFFIGSPIN